MRATNLVLAAATLTLFGAHTGCRKIETTTQEPLAAQPDEGRELSEVARTIAVQRATQVAIWAVPAVTTYGFARGTIQDLGGKLNDVVALSQPLTSRHGFLTANDVTPYAVASLTTADGPLVVEVPPASEKTGFFGTFVDAWMRPVADVGPTGTDQGNGGKYLFLPGGYEGSTPKTGYFVFPLEGHGINFAFRPVSQNGGTIEEAAAYARTLKVYPLAQAADPPATTFIDAFPKNWDTLPYYHIRLFEDIHAIVQSEPPRERDKSMFGLLREIGIEKGRPFEPTEEWKSIYEEAAQLAFEYLQETFVTPGGGLVPFYGDDSKWMTFNTPREQAEIGFPFEVNGVPLIDLRAMSYFYLSYYPKQLGPASFYIVALRDADGQQLNGKDTYRLNVPKDPPARDFWSVIAYSMVTKGFIRNAERVGLSSRQLADMTSNDDGSVDVYFAPTTPEGREANWIPTGEDFFLIFRLYGPKPSALDKSWKLNDVVRIRK
jgi:hypothetical protein